MIDMETIVPDSGADFFGQGPNLGCLIPSPVVPACGKVMTGPLPTIWGTLE